MYVDNDMQFENRLSVYLFHTMDIVFIIFMAYEHSHDTSL